MAVGGGGATGDHHGRQLKLQLAWEEEETERTGKKEKKEEEEKKKKKKRKKMVWAICFSGLVFVFSWVLTWVLVFFFGFYAWAWELNPMYFSWVCLTKRMGWAIYFSFY